MRVGDSLPFSVRTIRRPEIAFPLRQVSTSDRFVIAVTQDALISTSIGLQDAATFAQVSERRLTIRLFLLGAVTGLVLYNTMLSYVARNATFLFNALTITSMLMLDIYLTGVGAAYLWPEHPWLSNRLLGLALAGPSLFSPFYLYSFMEDRPLEAFFRMPRYWIWPAASLAGLAASLVLPLWPVYLFHTGLWIVMTTYFLGQLARQTAGGNQKASILLVPVLGAIVPAFGFDLVLDRAQEHGIGLDAHERQALARGQIQLIGATTQTEYKQSIA